MESDGWEKWMESALIHGKKPLDIAIDFFYPQPSCVSWIVSWC
jgi:hypothetical protein